MRISRANINLGPNHRQFGIREFMIEHDFDRLLLLVKFRSGELNPVPIMTQYKITDELPTAPNPRPKWTDSTWIPNTRSKKDRQYLNTHTEWGDCVILDNSVPSFNTLLFLQQQLNKISKAGNRTRVSCVTGRNTDHYTTSDLDICECRSISKKHHTKTNKLLFTPLKE